MFFPFPNRYVYGFLYVTFKNIFTRKFFFLTLNAHAFTSRYTSSYDIDIAREVGVLREYGCVWKFDITLLSIANFLHI